MACAVIMLFMGGCMRDELEANNLVGTWLARIDNDSNALRPKLILMPSGRFSVSNFPKSVACSSISKSNSINGKGEWELDSEASRIHLSFNEYANSECSTPYLSNVFIETVMFERKILLFSEGVDKPSAAIVLSKDE